MLEMIMESRAFRTEGHKAALLCPALQQYDELQVFESNENNRGALVEVCT